MRRVLFCILLVMIMLFVTKKDVRADTEKLPEAEQQEQMEERAIEEHEVKMPWEFSLIPTFQRGDFGLVDAANTINIPFKMKWRPSRFEISLTIPLQMAQVDIEKRSRRNGSRKFKRVETSKWNVGIGDILLDGRFIAFEEKKYLPEIALIGEVLFPTGDADKALGAGGFTGTVGVELNKYLVKQFALNAKFNYNRFGAPDDIESQNYLDYGAGFEIDFTPKFQFSADYDEMTSLVIGEGHPRSLDFTANYIISKMYEVTVAGLAGLNSFAPKFAFSGGLILHF